MKKRYMIVRIMNIVAEMKSSNEMITEECFTIVDKDYEEAEHAYRVMQKYREPSHYIIVEYWC